MGCWLFLARLHMQCWLALVCLPRWLWWAAWGMVRRPPALQCRPCHAVLRHALCAGALFLAAAGNEYTSNDYRPSYPASYQLDNVMSSGWRCNLGGAWQLVGGLAGACRSGASYRLVIVRSTSGWRCSCQFTQLIGVMGAGREERAEPASGHPQAQCALRAQPPVRPTPRPLYTPGGRFLALQHAQHPSVPAT